MALIELALTLETDVAGQPPEVRAFIDLNQHVGLYSETELPLARHGAHRWIGFFTIEERQRFFTYRIGVAAHAGGTWQLTVRRRDCACVLLRDEDELALPKLWLAGMCHLPE
jgi:hypothetical protein